MQFVERVAERYSNLFRNESGTEASFGEDFTSEWGWYQSIYTVAGGNVFDFEKATNLDIFTFLTFLEFKEHLAKETIKQNKMYE